MRKTILRTGCAVILLTTPVAYADTLSSPAQPPSGHPTHEQMEAVRDCAAKQGVDLPPPPQHGPPPESSSQKGNHGPGHGEATGPGAGPGAGLDQGQGPGEGSEVGTANDQGGTMVGAPGNPPPPPPPAAGPNGGPPHLTDAQKKIVDACFAAEGLHPPQHHGDAPHGEGSQGSAPGGPDGGGRIGPPPEKDFN